MRKTRRRSRLSVMSGVSCVGLKSARFSPRRRRLTPLVMVLAVLPGGLVSAHAAAGSTISVVTTIGVGEFPQGIVHEGGYIWVANSNPNVGGGTVSKIDVATDAVVATVAVGNRPGKIASDGTGHIWVTNWADGTVSKIDTAAEAVVATVTVGTEPWGIASDQDGHIWVTSGRDATVSKIDTATDAVVAVATVALGIALRDVAYDGAGHIWVTTSGKVWKVDAEANSVVATITMNPNQIFGVASDGRGNIWVSQFHLDQVSKIDASTAAVVSTVAVGDDPWGVTADGDGNIWVANSAGTTVTKIDTATDTVLATIAIGDSPNSIASDGAGNFWVTHAIRDGIVTRIVDVPNTVPDSPSAVVASAGDGQARVSWTAPTDDGGSAVTGYTVTASPGGRTCSSASTSCTVTGLTNGTGYRFSVTATNAVGTGPSSALSALVTPTGVTEPGAPTGVSASAGDGQARVSWTAPTDDGGSAVTGYTVTASPGGRTCSSASTSCTVTGLTNGTGYRFSVRATNAVGTGRSSALSASVTPLGVPGKPSSLSLSADGRLSWSVSNGGDPIDRHVVDYRKIEAPSSWLSPMSLQAAESPLTPMIVGGEYPGIDNHRYGVKVIAFKYGDAAYDCGGTLIAPQWVLTAAHCTEYQPFGYTYFEPEYVAVVYGLSDWTSFTDENRASHIQYGDTFYRHPNYDRANSANDVALIRLDAPVDMSQADTIPLFDLGGPVDGASGYASGWGLTSTGGTDSFEVKGTSVSVDASCGNWPSLFGSDWDDDAYLCASGYPSGVCNGDSGGPLVVKSDSIVFLAGAVSFGSAAGCAYSPDLPDVYTRISNYVDWIESHTGALWSSKTVASASTNPTTALSGIEAGKAYAVRIYAENSAGAGDYVLRRLVASVAVPSAPRNVSAFSDSPSATVSWSAPAFSGGDNNYTYRATASPGGLRCTTTTRSCTISGLERGQTYTVTVTAANSAGTGPASAGVSVDIAAGPDCTKPQSHPFTDVPTSSFAYDAVGCIYALGVTTGTSPTTYSPYNNVTREQMAAFLARFYEAATGKPCVGSHPFIDVPTSSFAYASVGCIYNLGVTTGTSPSTYSPSATVTREQMAAFIARLYRTITETGCSAIPPFSDVPTSSFARNDIGCIYNLGVTTGTSATTYSPSGNVTREQMAAFLARLYNTITA